MSAGAFSVGITNVTWTEGKPMFFSSKPDDAYRTMEKLNISYFVYDMEMKKGSAIEPGVTPKSLNDNLLKSYKEEMYILYSSKECKVFSTP